MKPYLEIVYKTVRFDGCENRFAQRFFEPSSTNFPSSAKAAERYRERLPQPLPGTTLQET